MILMIMGAIMIFLAILWGIFLLVLSMPIIFNFITNEFLLEKLFLRFGKENFSFALIKLKDNLMSNLVIYVFFGILMTLFFVLLTIIIFQIRHRKNYKVAIRLFYTNFALTGIIFTVLILMIIFTGIWWFSFILGFLGMGLFFLQTSFLSLNKNSINHKKYQIGNENHLDINNEIVNIRRNNIQGQQSLSLVKEQLHSEFLNDKDYETNEFDNSKLLVNSKASLPDILNPILLKENEDDGYEVPKIITEPIYEEIAADEMVFNSQITAQQVIVSDEQQQLDSKNNVISSGQQNEAADQKQMDINNANLRMEQLPDAYVVPSDLDLQYDYRKQPLMNNSSRTGNQEDECGKQQSFVNEYYQEQQQVQEQMLNAKRNVVLAQQAQQKEADHHKQRDINNANLQVEQLPEDAYVAPRDLDLQYDYRKQPLLNNSSRTGNQEDECGKQSFVNEYYQEQQQVQEQMLNAKRNGILAQQAQQKEAADQKQRDINNANLQVEQLPEDAYVAPRDLDLQYDYRKQPLLNNSSRTGNREDECGKQSFVNEYYQEQQQVQEQMLNAKRNGILAQQAQQKEAADQKQREDINNANLQVEQLPEDAYVAPRDLDLQYDYRKQPLLNNSSRTGNQEDECGKQSFVNEYYQEQQQVQEQMLNAKRKGILAQQAQQKEAADQKQREDINNANLQVEQLPEDAYVAPRDLDLQYDYRKQPLLNNSSRTGNREDECGKQSFVNEYYQEQQQVQEQMLNAKRNGILAQQAQQKEAADQKQRDINNANLQVEQLPEDAYVAPRDLDLQYDYRKQPLLNNSSRTGNHEDECGKQSFVNEYYQEQQQVQEQMLNAKRNGILAQQAQQKEAADQKQRDINNANLQVEQLPEDAYVAPRDLDLQYDYRKQPLLNNSSRTGNREDECRKQSFVNEYYQEQQQVQEQMLNAKRNGILAQQAQQKEAADQKQRDINNANLQVEQLPEDAYVAPRDLDLQYDYRKQPLLNNSSRTGNQEDECRKQSFVNEYYQEQQQVQEQMLNAKRNGILAQQAQQKEAADQKQRDINNANLQVEQLPEDAYVAPRDLDLQYDYRKQPLLNNSSRTGFANESHQNLNLGVNTTLNNLGNWFNQNDDGDTMIDPNKIYYHSPMTGKTIEINHQETQKFLFADLPGKPDELESPVYEYNPIEEQNKKSKQNKKKNHESRSYGNFDQTMQYQANPVGIKGAVPYPQGYVQARYQTKDNYYEQPALNINLPKQETYDKSVVNQQFGASAIAEHYHSQYPNYTFTNDSCPICYQGG